MDLLVTVVTLPEDILQKHQLHLKSALAAQSGSHVYQ
jgi:hypothetical protein